MLTETERLEVEKVIHDSIGWALTKDIDRLFSIMAQDDDFFIFHPDSTSTIIGFEAFKKLGERVWMKDEFKATDFAVRDLRVKFAELGNVAWYSCFLDDHAEWNGQPIGWDNCRWTGTLTTFVRVRRQKYCSRRCGNAATMRAYKARHG